ncbi:MAG: hypothetical protein AB1490_21685 [Pseudomonadota bacterium]
MLSPRFVHPPLTIDDADPEGLPSHGVILVDMHVDRIQAKFSAQAHEK